jgi:hypothetical protein
MICGASIATRTGYHGSCSLERGHRGSCVPQDTWIAAAVEWPEAKFCGHLLALVESAGDTLTVAEAFNVARSLLRARLGLEILAARERRT